MSTGRFTFTTKKNTAYILWSCILMAITAIMGQEKNTFVSAAIIVGFVFLFMKPEFMIAPIFFATVFDDYLLAFNGQSFGRFFVIVFILSVALQSLFRKNVMNTNTTATILLMLFPVLFSMWGAYGYTGGSLPIILNMLLAVALMMCPMENHDEIIKHFQIIVLLAVGYLVYLYFNGNLTLSDVSGRLDIGDEINANQVAMGVAMLSTIQLSLFMIGRYKNKIINVIMILVSFFGVFITGSRSALLAAMLSCILIYIIANPNKGLKPSIVIGLLVSAVAFYALYTYLELNYPVLMKRFTISSVVESGGTNRIAIWKAFFNGDFKKYWLFGIGFNPQNMVASTYAATGMLFGAHNVIVDIISKVGVFGAVVFVGYFISIFKKMLNGSKINTFILIPLSMFLCIFVNGIGENILGTRFLWLSIGLGVLFCSKSACLNKSNINEKGDEI